MTNTTTTPSRERGEYGLNDAPCPICGGEKQTITVGRRTEYGEYERFVIRGFCSLGCAYTGCGAGEHEQP